MKIKSVMTLHASLNSTCRARRKDGIVPTQGGHIKKKNPHCETGIMQNCRDSPNRREKPRSHFPVLFPPPDKPPHPRPSEPTHGTHVFAPGVFTSLPCLEAVPHRRGRQMSPRRLRRRQIWSGSREYSGRRRGHDAALICVFKRGVVSAPPLPESLRDSQHYFFCCVCNLLSA